MANNQSLSGLLSIANSEGKGSRTHYLLNIIRRSDVAIGDFYLMDDSIYSIDRELYARNIHTTSNNNILSLTHAPISCLNDIIDDYTKNIHLAADKLSKAQRERIIRRFASALTFGYVDKKSNLDEIIQKEKSNIWMYNQNLCFWKYIVEGLSRKYDEPWILVGNYIKCLYEINFNLIGNKKDTLNLVEGFQYGIQESTNTIYTLFLQQGKCVRVLGDLQPMINPFYGVFEFSIKDYSKL